MLALFTRTKPTVVAVTVPPAPPERTALASSAALPEGYMETARKVGVLNGAMKEALVRGALAEMGLAPYRYEEVRAYLDGLFGRAKNWRHTWGWRPLREVDRKTAELSPEWNTNGHTLNRTYQLAVPLPVLHTIERLSAAVPGLGFFVSDQITAQDNAAGDPFLVVMAPGMPILVIEQWDEPNFTGKRE